MSCIIADIETIDVITSWMSQNGYGGIETQRMGHRIHKENRQAYSHRYRERLSIDLCERGYYLTDLPVPYQKVIKCARFLDYQIADHKAYPKNEASVFLEQIVEDILFKQNVTIEEVKKHPLYQS
jgi:hypothetical protein